MMRLQTSRPPAPQASRTLWIVLGGIGLAAVAGVAAVVRRRTGQHGRGRPGPLELEATTVVGVDPQTAYERWRGFESLPDYLPHLESVTPTAEGLYRWTSTAPLVGSVSWEAELTGDEPGQRISWLSRPSSQIDNSGTVHFAATPDGSGTEVKVVLHYDVPGGRLGEAVAAMFGEDPQRQVRDALDQFKQDLEAGAGGASAS
jgi:uncharacterized membrane protein